MGYGMSNMVIKLLLKLRILSFLRQPRFSILKIRLSFRSSTSKFGSSSKFSIVSIRFLLKISTRRCRNEGNLLISLILL